MIALKDAAVGLVISLGGCFVISVFRSARMLDYERCESIGMAQNETAQGLSVINQVRSELDAVRAEVMNARAQPKISSFEQIQRDSVIEQLKDWTEAEKRILEHLLQHEQQDRSDLVRFCGNLIPADAAMNKGKIAGLIQWISPHGSQIHYRITPSFVEALKFYFYGA